MNEKKDCVLGFSDEASISQNRFRSISLVSFTNDNYKPVNEQLCNILDKYKDFKFRNIDTKPKAECGKRIIDYVIKNRNIRIDTIIWDTEDSRCRIKNRDDFSNFQIMYYHLLNYAINNKWENSDWKICPDQNCGVDWNILFQCLNRDTKYNLKLIEQMNSRDEKIIQLADFFAGLSTFFNNNRDNYLHWENRYVNTYEIRKVNNAHLSKYNVCKHLFNECTNNYIKISYRTNKLLHTVNPKDRINFWLYTPQSPLDKAPTKIY